MHSSPPPSSPRSRSIAGLALERRLLAVDGHTVAVTGHLLDDGRAPVVFLHGVLTTTELVGELFDDPAAESWLAVSLPGHAAGSFAAGTTAAEITPELYVRLTATAIRAIVGSRPVILVGWSLGGFTALALAASGSANVAAVASLAGFGRPSFSGLVWILTGCSRLPVTRRLVAFGLWLAGRRPLMFRLLSLLTAHDLAACRTPAARAAIRRVWRRFRRHDPESLRRVLASLRRLDLGEAPRRIGCPVWIAGGRDDPVVSRRETRRLAAEIPQARLTEYAGGHLFFCEWQGFRRDLAAWLAEVRGGRAAATADQR